jgi:hypothetical protein
MSGFSEYDIWIYKTISMLLEEHKTGHEIMTELQISRNQFYRLKDKMKLLGIHPVYDPTTMTYSLNKNIALTEEEAVVVSRLSKLGLNKKQIDAVIEAFSKTRPPTEPVELEFSELKIKFGVISDLHIGSKYYRPDVLQHAIENFKREKVQFVINCGDTIEGMSDREGHIYELELPGGLGVTNQVNLLANEFKPFDDIGLDVYSIEAQGSHGGWSYKKSNMGLEIHDYIESKVPAYKFLGYNEATLVVEGIKIRIRHPERGNVQSYVNSLPGGHKPHMVFDGHFHNRTGYVINRNVHCFDCGTMQDQTPFLERMSSPSLVGYYIIEITIGEATNGSTQVRLTSGKYLESVSVKFVPFYD